MARTAGEARSIRLAGREVEYELRRSTRRTLGLSIGPGGLRLAVPQRLSLAQAEAFLHEKADWILPRLEHWAAQSGPAPLVVADGLEIPMLGEPVRVSVRAGANRVRWVEAPFQREVHLFARRAEDCRALLLRAVQGFALEYFSGRVSEYVALLRRRHPGVALPPVRLSNASGRWGSCSQRSGIRLHWRLIHLPLEQIDYVVAHEVAHLVQMNHSPAFWAEVAALMPDWQPARAALRQAQRVLPEF